MSNTDDGENVYCTVKQIASDPSLCFTAPMLRYYILHAHQNGLSTAIRRIGKKIIIRKDLFIDWIENQAARGSKKKNDKQL